MAIACHPLVTMIHSAARVWPPVVAIVVMITRMVVVVVVVVMRINIVMAIVMMIPIRMTIVRMTVVRVAVVAVVIDIQAVRIPTDSERRGYTPEEAVVEIPLPSRRRYS